jgi:glycosidase
LRIILDVVPNHVHIDHPYFEQHRGDGWFNGLGGCVCGSTCSWAEDLDRCWFSEYLADLRWKNPEVANQIVDDTIFWLESFDIDGLRIDAIPMMPLLATREIVDAVRRGFEQGPTGVHLLGETYTGRGDYETIARALGPHGLDGQFDFPLL